MARREGFVEIAEDAREEVQHILDTCDYNSEVDHKLQRILRILDGETVEEVKQIREDDGAETEADEFEADEFEADEFEADEEVEAYSDEEVVYHNQDGDTVSRDDEVPGPSEE